MNLDFLNPIDQTILDKLQSSNPSCIGHKIKIHSTHNFPNLEDVKIAIFGIRENRRAKTRLKENFNFTALRQSFYNLYSGNWHLKIADLGDILPGETVEDTDYAVKEVTSELLQKNIIPILLGGSQDLTYSQYRAYEYSGKMLNLTNIDALFDIGDVDSKMAENSYVGKMIVNQPYNLFNYANIGYQSYLNPPNEIDLIEQLFFDAFRLGEINNNINLAEPIMRDTDLVSIDIQAISSSASKSKINQPNGFNGREICALSRYAGISDKVSSFGLYNLQNIDGKIDDYLLTSEMLWYFIEGVNFRKNEENILGKNNTLKYSVPIDNEVLTFYKSKLSGRWWIEIPTFVNNKLKKHTFLPCTYQDYLDACNQEIPRRWYKARCKNEL